MRLNPNFRRPLVAGVLLMTLGIAGCAVDPGTAGCAIREINQAFQVEYEKVLAELGVRRFKVRRADAFVALHASLARFGMRVVDQDPDLGTMVVDAPAPRPLNADEWRKVGESDLPRLRELAARCVGPLRAQMIRFEPEGLEVVIHVTVVEVAGESEVALTARMSEIAPPVSGMPRREYLPPSATRMALVKIWAQMEAELRAARRIP